MSDKTTPTGATATSDPATDPAKTEGDPAPATPAAEPAAPTDDPKALAAQLVAARVEGATAERTRILAILGALGKTGDGATIRACLQDPACTVEAAALRVVQAGQGKVDAQLAALAGDEAAPKPPAAPPSQDDGQSPQAVATRVLKTFGAIQPDRIATAAQRN